MQYTQNNCPFTDRNKELHALEQAYENRPGLVVVYGRRRVGKTRLIAEWLARLAGKKHVYYLAHLSSHDHNLELFAERAAQQLGDPVLARTRPRNLATLITLIERGGAEVIVIDEFTYWVRSSPRVLSELQEYIDLYLGESNVLLIVSGSLVGVMEKSVLGGGSPLYARASTRLRLGELPYKYVQRIVPGLSSSDRVRLYALVGGIPFYLCMARRANSVVDIVEGLLVSPGAPLLYEKDLLLREELRDPHSYNAILSALAKGYDTPSKISQVTGIEPAHIHKYLSVLEYLGFVEKRTPLFKKKGKYTIRDPVLRTWYSLVEPVLELIEIGVFEKAIAYILSRLDSFTSPVWESIARQHLLSLYAGKGFTLPGFLEHKGVEVDIVVLNTRDRQAVIGEAKWGRLSRREAERIRNEAFRKAAQLLPREYSIVDTYVAAREAENEEDYWVITPYKIEKNT